MSIPTNCTPSHLSLALTITKSQRLLLSLSLSEKRENRNSRFSDMFAEQPLSLMEQDWDLHAVVRGCCSTRTSSTTTRRSAITTTASSSVSSSSGFGTCNYLQLEAAASSSSSSSCGGGGGFSSLFDCEQGIRSQQVLSLPSAYTFEARSPIEELHELCKPFFTRSQPQQQHHQQQQSLQASSSSSPLSSFSYTSVAAAPIPVQTQEKQQQHQQQRNKHPHQGGSVTTPRSKRRKNQLKRVCQVPVENLSSDIWAWRKYGQKPIKGSPYPRGYYRCSSSKGCLARKQVERNRSDPTMFIVTYTAEHNHPAPTHRNSLAGSTRQKPLTPQTAAATTTTTGGEECEKALAKPTSPVTPVVEEEAPPQGEKSSESKEEKEDVMDDDEVEGDEFVLSDMVLPDDFFESLDELGQLTGIDDAVTGDCFTDPFSAMALPCLGGQ